MAVTIPIVSEFNGKGIAKAIKQFQQLETTGEKAQFALKKAALPAAAAFGAVTAGLASATKAAIEDEQAQTQLANTLKNTVKATDQQIKATEDSISTMSRQSGIADDQLRPAFAALTLGTKNLATSQKAMALAMDIATSTGQDLVSVSDALAKAYGGNMKGLAALSPEIKAMIKDGASLDEVMATLAQNFGGATAANAETAAGKMAILNNSINETKESIGAAFLPVMEKLQPKLQAFADWAENNPEKLTRIIEAIGLLSGAILLANGVLKTYNTTAGLVTASNQLLGASFAGAKLSVGIFSAAAAIAFLTIEEGYGLMRDKSAFDELKLSFRQAGQAIAAVAVFIGNQIYNIVSAVNNGIVQMANDAIRALNIISPFKDVPYLPESGTNPFSQPSFFYTPGNKGSGGMGVPAMANGGIVSKPTLALIGESGPEAVVPLNRGMGTGVIINISGGLGTSTDIANAVYENLRFYNQNVGPLRIRTA